MKKVLMITSEALPFATTGNMASEVTALTKALNDLGIDARVFMPQYDKANAKFYTQFVSSVDVNTPMGMQTMTFTKAPMDNLTYYFLEHPIFCSQKNVYDNPDGNYPNPAFNFSFFCMSIEYLFEVIPDWKADILHIHDWPGCMASYLYKGKIPTVLTVHDASYQGVASPFTLAPLGINLPPEAFDVSNNGRKKLNLFKLGFMYADKIATDNKNYKKNIFNNENTGIKELMLKREKDFFENKTPEDYEAIYNLIMKH